jgi:hypothetical protein
VSLFWMLACQGPSKPANTEPADTGPPHTDSSDSEPPAEEVCNGLDDDGDGEIDEGLSFAAWTDLDGDGYGDPATEAQVCALSSGQVTESCDCDDTDADVHLDPLTCPRIECPEAEGVWIWGECGQATEIVHDGSLSLSEDSNLTLCSGDQGLALVFSGERLRVQGEDRDGVSWHGLPALQVASETAEITLESLSLGNVHYNNSAGVTEEGLVILAEGAGVDLSLRDVRLDDVDAWIHYSSGVKVGGDLRIEDSLVEDWEMGVSSSASNVCTSRLLDVGGDLHLTRTRFADIAQYCGSWSHSAWGKARIYMARVGGSATLEEVEFERVVLENRSSGVQGELLGALLHADGDLSIQGLDIRDCEVASSMSCQASSCTRYLTGALIGSDGDVSWSQGSIEDSPVHLDGSMAGSGSWIDSAWTASISWSGESLVLDQVDLGEQEQVDVRGTWDHDGSGLTSLSCTSAGCE